MTATDLHRDVGQLCWLGFEGADAPAALRRAIAEGRVGAVILFARNLPRLAQDNGGDRGAGAVDARALRALTDALHAAATGDPLWVAVDQEGGRVQRVRDPATVWPPMLALDRVPDAGAPALAEKVGEAMGRELAALGFDVDFAPVLDVHTNPANPVIGDRAFATEPGRAADRALAFARGLGRAGVVACGKHFPGHGDTATDSHLALPRLDHDRARLDAVELVPFARAAAAGIPLIMTAHVVFACLDGAVPATMSRRVMTDLLRGELGFGGVAVSDDLDMRAIADHHDAGDAAVAAVEAGCDALLLCRDPGRQAAAYEALLRAGQARASMRERIAEAAGRVRAAKRAHLRERGRASERERKNNNRGRAGERERNSNSTARATAPAASLDVLGAAEHRALADRLARA